MKNLLLLLLVLPLVFGSCSKDDDKDMVPSLKSTVWEGIQDETKATVTFSELESTLVLSSTVIDYSLSASYTYTYEHPKVTMYPKESGKARMEGTVSSDYKTMILINTSTGKTISTLTKK